MRRLTLCSAALLLAACGRQAAPSVAASDQPPPVAAGAAALPPLTGRVVDRADLYTPDEEARLAAISEALERRTTDQLVIVTLPDLQGRPIEEVGLALGRGWGVGGRDKANGVLLITAPAEHKVRIEVGCGLERILTNERAARIIDRDIIPADRASRFADGTAAGAQAIAEMLTAAADAPRVPDCRR